MAKLPYFQFYPSDWLSSPRIMCATLTEQGAYIRVLCACWMSGDCSIPNDDRKISLLSGMPEGDLSFIRQMFVPHPSKSGHLTNERLLKEWEKAHCISESRTQAGKKSGKSRRTNVQQVFEQNTNKTRTNSDKSEVRSQKSEVIVQKSDLEVRNHKSDSEEEKKEERKNKSCGQVKTVPAIPKSSAAWTAYEEAYRTVYGVDPVRNQQANALMCRLVDKLGAEEAPAVAAFYLSHRNPFYVAKRHPPNLLVQDAEGLRTQWITGCKATRSEIKQAELKDDAREQVKRVEAMLTKGGL